jgi:hypothetical protein
MAAGSGGVIGHLYHRLAGPAGSDGEFEVFESTADTRSNWGPDLQHGSPPLALMTKAIEEQAPDGMRIGRLALDILGAIPVAPLQVRLGVADRHQRHPRRRHRPPSAARRGLGRGPQPRLGGPARLPGDGELAQAAR